MVNILISLAIFFIFLCLALLVIDRATSHYAPKRRILEYHGDIISKANSKSLLEPLVLKFNKAMLKITSTKRRQVLQGVLERSGLSRRFSLSEWQTLKFTLSFFLSFVLTILLSFLNLTILSLAIYFILLYGLILYAFRWYVLLQIKKRSKIMRKDLPYVLDLITIGVQAGLSFDTSIIRVVSTKQTPLTYELERFVKEVSMGIVRKQGLLNVMNRVALEDFTTVVQAVIQADELGSSLAHVLKIQSQIMREKRKMTARERALKAPIKMLFPLIFFIFPTVFVVILGPAVIRMISIFL